MIKPKTDKYSVIVTKTAALRVWWAGTKLPPVVYPHKICHGVGKLVTYNGGENWRIIDAVPFTERYWKVMGPVFKYLWHYLEDPEEWLLPEELHARRWRF